jgi:c-di-GMP-binding flagellar brake protein YcgR
METKGEEKVRFGVANFERRRHPRFSVDLPIEYHRIYSADIHQGRSSDISKSGLMVYLAEKPEMGQFLDVKLFFPSDTHLQAIAMIAQVVWVDLHLGENRDYRSGLKFIEISQEDLNKLSGFLNHLARI